MLVIYQSQCSDQDWREKTNSLNSNTNGSQEHLNAENKTDTSFSLNFDTETETKEVSMLRPKKEVPCDSMTLSRIEVIEFLC